MMNEENNMIEALENLLLEAEDGKVYEFEPMVLFEVEGNDYMAFRPVSEDDGTEIIFFGVREEELGVSLIQIEDDNEYELVGLVFLELMKTV